MKVKIALSKGKKLSQTVASKRFSSLKRSMSYLSHNLSALMFIVFFSVVFLPAHCWHLTNGGTVFFIIFSQRGFTQKKKSFCPRQNIHHQKL
jgi:hypothetical protein